MNKLVIGLMILFVIAGLLLFNLKIFQKTGEMTNEKKLKHVQKVKRNIIQNMKMVYVENHVMIQNLFLWQNWLIEK